MSNPASRPPGAVVIVALALAVLASVPHPRAQQGAASRPRAFVGGHLVGLDGAPSIDNAVILVSDGRIVAVGPREPVTLPQETTTIDLAGTFVIPGLVSAHVHVSDVDGLRPRTYTRANTLRQLGVFARYGITTVWSLGGEETPAMEVRDAQHDARLDRARLYVAGEVIAARTPGEARAAVARVAASRADVVKIRIDDNLGTAQKMPPEVYRAVIDAAHARGLRVAVHIFYLDDAKDALRAGADVIAHSVRDRDVDEEFLSLMASRGAAYIPTLTREISTFAYDTTPSFFADPFFTREADPAVVAQLSEPVRQAAMRASPSAARYRAGLAVALRNLKRISDAGILVAMGTDAGAFPERFEGYFEHLEMQMMAEAGLTPAQVLRSATAGAARAMRVEGVGAIAPGAWADIVALRKDPGLDIGHTREIAGVWVAGNAVPARGAAR